MKTRNLFLTSAFAVSLCFAAEEAASEAEAAQPNVVESCYAAIDNAAKDIPANATSAKLTLSEAKVNAIELDAAYKEDAESEQVKALAANCDTYAKLVATQADGISHEIDVL